MSAEQLKNTKSPGPTLLTPESTLTLTAGGRPRSRVVDIKTMHPVQFFGVVGTNLSERMTLRLSMEASVDGVFVTSLNHPSQSYLIPWANIAWVRYGDSNV
jgi:hypothetical protein